MWLILIIIIILILLYKYGTRNFSYWEKKGVKYDKPIPFFGNNLEQLLLQKTITDKLVAAYKKYPNEKFVGSYAANYLDLILIDPDIIKRVLIKDFHYFHERGMNPCKDVVEPMFRNLFFADGDIWKLLRQRLSPVFTSGKLKAMFPLIVERAEKLQKIAASYANTGAEVDIRDVMARYATDFIGACAFGIDADSLNDENSKFRQLGKRIFAITIRDAFVTILKIIAPETFKYLHFLVPEIEENTVALVKGIMKNRNHRPSGRNDFIDLLLELKQKGKIVGESIQKRDINGKPEMVEIEFDDLLMAAQVFVFFAAGFETSSSATSFTLHQLAYHPEEQRKCQMEIDDVLSKHDNVLSYDAIKEMKYLEMAFKESMRIFPPLGFLIRKCVKKYTIPGTDVTIDEGVSVSIPLQALHNDEKYFDEPDKFIPERFSSENLNNVMKNIYMPFGDGPRACIGERLGLMQSLAGLAAILSQFSVAPSKNSKRHPPTDPTSNVVQKIKDGVPLTLITRKKVE